MAAATAKVKVPRPVRGGRQTPRSTSASGSSPPGTSVACNPSESNVSAIRISEGTMRLKEVVTLFKDAGVNWAEDKASRLGAALAYYTLFALAPLLVIIIGVAGLAFGQETAQTQVLGQVQGLVGEEGGKAVGAMVQSAGKPGAGLVGTILGAAMLLFGAAGLFGQLQDALNTIWKVEPKPGRGIWGFIKDRFLSFSMVLGVAFLLLVSLVVSAALAALAGLFGDWQTSVLGQIVNTV